MDGPSPYDVAGALGVALYLGSYLALQIGLIRGSGYAYAALNLGASALVLLSLARDFNAYSAVIQVAWIVISLLGIARIYLLTRRARFTPEEERFRRAMLAALPRSTAHQLISAGRWMDAEGGTVLVTENDPALALFYLSEGAAEVSVGGLAVARAQAPTLLGEMSALSNLPATASVVLTEKARVWRIPAARLRQMGTDPEMRMLIEGVLARDTRQKLIGANARAADT